MARGALPRVVLFLYLRVVSVRLPSFLSCSSGVLRPGGCVFPWVSASTTCVLAYSSGACFLGVVCSFVCLRSHSHLRCCGSVFLLHPCLVRRLSLRRLCFFGAFAMRSPCLGRVSVVGSPTRSERRLSLLVSFVFLRDGVTLWVKCVLQTLLITIKGLPFAIGSCSFRLGSHAGCYCLRHVFPWLGIIVCLCATLIFPVWLLSAL